MFNLVLLPGGALERARNCLRLYVYMRLQGLPVCRTVAAAYSLAWSTWARWPRSIVRSSRLRH